MRQHVRFLRQYLTSPSSVGAVWPSSQSLARALCEPYACADRPSAILEVGAGTGAVTRYLGRILRPTDQLDVCELAPAFLRVLEEEVLSDASFDRARNESRVRLIPGRVQDLPGAGRYDFVISGLPLTAFSPEDVDEVIGTVRRLIRPGGVFSYFEYVGLRRLSRWIRLGDRRRRMRRVSSRLDDMIRAHQFRRRVVLANIPPAYARHLCFDKRR
ncbi:MAG: methyltransferase domain-containing protein [Phycisphaerales bacterium]|nr:MAG: methyltransferase domain-containing protein [Phycisphaerales bacterium]